MLLLASCARLLFVCCAVRAGWVGDAALSGSTWGWVPGEEQFGIDRPACAVIWTQCMAAVYVITRVVLGS
jgi:hypothetical protein